MKALFSIILIVIISISGTGLLTCTGQPQTVLCMNEKLSQPVFVFSHDTTIFLHKNGTAYGHVLLWKANTTGTNYEESAVVYLDGIAYIGSCSTHGDGHDKLFAVDTTDGSILWSKISSIAV